MRVFSASADLVRGNSEVVCKSSDSDLRATGVDVAGGAEDARGASGSDLRATGVGGIGDTGEEIGGTSGPDLRESVDEADAAGALAGGTDAAICLEPPN